MGKPPRKRRLSPEQRRAVESLLASSPHGTTEELGPALLPVIEHLTARVAPGILNGFDCIQNFHPGHYATDVKRQCANDAKHQCANNESSDRDPIM
jgi:hypothetical protein